MSTNPPPSALFRKVKQSIDLKEHQQQQLTNNKKEQLIKVIGGNEHTICLFNNGDMFADGWNDYGHYGIKPLELKQNECKISGMKMVNSSVNKILQHCKVIDIFTKFHFTVYLAIHNETKKQILLASGWNYGGCCSCNITGEKEVNEISQCYFIQKNTKNGEEIMVNTLQNEKIIKVACGGCHLCILTEDIVTKEQFIYECGKNSSDQMSEGMDIPILKKSKLIMDFIKLNDNNQLRIKQICGGAGNKSFVTESGKLFVIGQQLYSNIKKLQQIPQSLFDNELVKEVSEHEGIALVLTHLGNLFLFKSREKGQPTKFSFKKKKIVNFISFKETALAFFDDFSVFYYQQPYHGPGIKKKLTLQEYLFEENITKDSKEYQLLKYYLDNKSNYDFYFVGDKQINLVVQYKEKLNYLAQKLKYILLQQNNNNNDKNYFYDITLFSVI